MPTTQRTDDHTHTITRTHERFDLYLEIIIIISGVSTAAWNPEYNIEYVPSYEGKN